MNPLEGGPVPKITATTSVLHRWKWLQAICEVTGEEKGIESIEYKGAATQWIEVVAGEDKNPKQREIDDGILLVVSARIYDHQIGDLIDSGATRSFFLSGAVLPLGLKSTSEDTLLELGNGDRILFRGKVSDVPVVTASLSVKLDLTVTKLLHSDDVVLGMICLCTVNPNY